MGFDRNVRLVHKLAVGLAKRDAVIETMAKELEELRAYKSLAQQLFVVLLKTQGVAVSDDS